MNLADLTLFIRIADTGSISEAARQLDISTAAASAALKRLEQQLAMVLFTRSTRQLRITPHGEQYLYHCRQALLTLEQGQALAHAQQGKLSGQLRLSAPSDLGRNLLLPWLDELLEQHPALSIDLSLGDSLSNFYTDQIDLALRYGKPQDSSMVAFEIARVRRKTCASPAYLQQHDLPNHPSDLAEHDCLLHRIGGRVFNTWQYSDAGKLITQKVSGKRVTNDTEVARRWAIAGLGITHRFELDVKADIDSEQLVALLEQYPSPTMELYLLCPSQKQVTPLVLALRDRLRERCRSVLEG